MLNYSFQDLLAVSIAFVLFPLFVFVPGYMLGVVFDMFRFRERTPFVRTLLSIPLSIALTPTLIFILGSKSLTLVWIVYAVTWLGFAVILVVPGFPKPYGQPMRMGVWVPGLLICLSIAAALCLSLIDLQVGDKLYVSVSAYDYNFRAAVIDSITRRGIPPINPFLHPGSDAPFRYHYFWFMICSLVDTLGGKLVSARQAQIAGTAWIGTGLCAFVALYLRFFDPKGAKNIRKRTYAGLLLLAVSGLDIFPLLLKSLSSVMHRSKLIVLGSAEWWSADPVTSWTHALLWVPHHVAGVIACFIGFLILWDLDPPASPLRRAVAWLGAALAFASASGLSIHVTFAFACAMLAWGVVCLWQRWFWRTADLVAAGLLAIAIDFPYLLSLVASGERRGTEIGAGGAAAAASIPLSFGVRQFRPFYAILTSQGFSSKMFPLADLLALPLNYVAEFGFFAVIAVLFFRRPHTKDVRTKQYELAVASILGTVLLVCTFVRSTVIGNNDLGWRGILIAQFLLVIVAVDYLLALKPANASTIAIRPFTRILLIGLFWIGLLPSVFEVITQRFHPALVGANLIAADLEEENSFGRRTASLRQIYGKLNQMLPKEAIVQHNPISMQDIASGLYADRQRVLMGSVDYTGFGGNMQDQERARGLLQKLFSAESTEANLNAACRTLGITSIVLTDDDPVWLNKQSWAWKRKPFVEAPYARAFSCFP